MMNFQQFAFQEKTDFPDPIDYEAYVLKHHSAITLDPLCSMALFPKDDVIVSIAKTNSRVVTTNCYATKCKPMFYVFFCSLCCFSLLVVLSFPASAYCIMFGLASKLLNHNANDVFSVN